MLRALTLSERKKEPDDQLFSKELCREEPLGAFGLASLLQRLACHHNCQGTIFRHAGAILKKKLFISDTSFCRVRISSQEHLVAHKVTNLTKLGPNSGDKEHGTTTRVGRFPQVRRTYYPPGV